MVDSIARFSDDLVVTGIDSLSLAVSVVTFPRTTVVSDSLREKASGLRIDLRPDRPSYVIVDFQGLNSPICRVEFLGNLALAPKVALRDEAFQFLC